MSDLDGMDAFTTLLDRLVDAEIRILARGTASSGALREAQAQMREMQTVGRKMNEAGSQLLAIVKEIKDRSPEVNDAIKLGDEAFDTIPY